MPFDEKTYKHNYYIEHKEEIRLKQKRYAEQNKERIRLYKKRWNKENKDRIRANKKRWYEENKDRLRGERREYKREYQQEKYKNDPEYREMMRAFSAKYRKKRQHEVKAVNAVNKAIKSGKLIRKPCEVCGAEPAQAHHDDYNYPLKVRWLCSMCHAEWHRNNQPIRKEANNELAR